jgi:hypothetical protein
MVTFTTLQHANHNVNNVVIFTTLQHANLYAIIMYRITQSLPDDRHTVQLVCTYIPDML